MVVDEKNVKGRALDPIRTTQLDPSPDVINLAIGQPSPSLLPLELMRQAAAHRLREHPELLAYGLEQGDGRFRQTLAEFLTDAYRARVAAGQLFVTAGASQALDLVCTLFTRPGDTVLVEDPSYFLALRIFTDHGLDVIGIPMDENGLIVPALEELLEKCRPAFIYTIPTFHNPGGCVLSATRRRELIRISRERNLPVVADEVYHLLNYGADLPQPLGCHADTAPIISLGSFSKIMAPGLRLGWIQTGKRIMARLTSCGLLDSGGGLNPFTSNLVRSAIELGLQQKQLSLLKDTYDSRLRALSDALRRDLGGRLSFDMPAGGFFIWAALPETLDSNELLPAAGAAGVGYLPGTRCSPSGGLRNWMRLSFAYYDADDLERGSRRLARALLPRLDG
jgi:DNA-binding transcriptional MocR family regulator